MMKLPLNRCRQSPEVFCYPDGCHELVAICRGCRPPNFYGWLSASSLAARDRPTRLTAGRTMGQTQSILIHSLNQSKRDVEIRTPPSM